MQIIFQWSQRWTLQSCKFQKTHQTSSRTLTNNEYYLSRNKGNFDKHETAVEQTFVKHASSVHPARSKILKVMKMLWGAKLKVFKTANDALGDGESLQISRKIVLQRICVQEFFEGKFSRKVIWCFLKNIQLKQKWTYRIYF